MERPVGVAEGLAGDQHQVRIAPVNHLGRLVRAGDQSDGCRCDVRPAADLGGKGNLVPGRARNRRTRHVAAGGDRPWLFDEEQFFDAQRAREAMGSLAGSVLLDLPLWQNS